VGKRLEPTVMLADGAVVGFACFYRHRPGRFMYVGNVMIQPGLRQQGFGRTIMVHMVELAFGKYDVPQVRVSIVAENTPSLLACVGGGFRPYGVMVRKNRHGKRLPLLNLRLNRDRYLKSRQ
jgi:RimJ/RimL family protein N-acetyltransferase